MYHATPPTTSPSPVQPQQQPIGTVPPVQPQQQSQQQQQQASQPSDANTLEKELETSPEDFSKWELFVSRREQEQNVPLIRSAYDKLLTEYPLLYGYWKKYADLEVSQSSPFSDVVSVYERGVTAIPYSVDLWMHYCVYVAEVSDDLGHIRSLFERAITTVGDDYLASTLWDKYIEFEESQEEYARVLQLYTRVLSIPLKSLQQYWERMTRFISTKSTNVLLSSEELAQLDASISSSSPNTTIDEEARIRELISVREKIYGETSVEWRRRSEFEQGIERPYFHVQPLGVNELSTWRRYLENEEECCTEDRVVKLYERCLIACALYFEFWQRYASYLESKNRVEDARNALNRAAKTFLKRKPTPQIHLAEFEESQGETETAKQIFINSLENPSVGRAHLETIVRFAQFYRRQNMHEEAQSLLREQRGIVESNESKSLLSVQHAHYVCNLLNNVEGGRSILDQCVQEIPSSTMAWLALVEYEVRNASKTDSTLFTNALQPVYDRIVALSDEQLPASDRVTVLNRYLSHVINYSSVQHVRTVEKTLLHLKTKTSAQSKKRKAEEDVDGPAKVARTETDATAAASATAAAATNSAAYQQQWYNYYAQYYQQYPQAGGAVQPDAYSAQAGVAATDVYAPRTQ